VSRQLNGALAGREGEGGALPSHAASQDNRDPRAYLTEDGARRRNLWREPTRPVGIFRTLAALAVSCVHFMAISSASWGLRYGREMDVQPMGRSGVRSLGLHLGRLDDWWQCRGGRAEAVSNLARGTEEHRRFAASAGLHRERWMGDFRRRATLRVGRRLCRGPQQAVSLGFATPLRPDPVRPTDAARRCPDRLSFPMWG
jgi:hypothetical protein